MEIDASKMVNFGGVTFVPVANIDVVRDTMTWNGMKLAELEQSHVLPGYLGWIAKAQDKRKSSSPPAAAKP